jgi:beta-1,2-mannobiose phosphorylase / 1,2-beta-oligomannan phosphorylase
MPELAHRFDANPLLTPADVKPSRPDWTVECLLNPGVFRFGSRTGLLIRVAERPPQEPGWLSTPFFDPESRDGIRVLRISEDDPRLDYPDPRLFTYDGVTYLTTLSHLRIAWSDDGVHFKVDESPTLLGHGPHETFGVEDCRVSQIGMEYYLTYTAVSQRGVAVGAIRTLDWKHYDRLGLILPPHNKDCAIFEHKVGESFYCLHRPSGVVGLGGNFIWIARSPDLLHWGHHQCIAMTRHGGWDSVRVGAGASPIRTDKGWLELYHGADDQGIYCLGLLLMDLRDPYNVLARSREPVMHPIADYEKKGFVGGVVFTNGHLIDGDKLTIYYGAADTVVCGATFSINKLLASLM